MKLKCLTETFLCMDIFFCLLFVQGFIGFLRIEENITAVTVHHIKQIYIWTTLQKKTAICRKIQLEMPIIRFLKLMFFIFLFKSVGNISFKTFILFWCFFALTSLHADFLLLAFLSSVTPLPLWPTVFSD